VILALIAVAHKYHIDTSGTIAELSKDRKLYQRMAWQEIEAREKFMKSHAAAVADLTTKLKDISSRLSDLDSLVSNSEMSKSSKEKILLQIKTSINDISPFIVNQNNADSPRVKRSF
jgi:K+/H+ antiporter YhaU regulatory subunit KhtT